MREILFRGKVADGDANGANGTWMFGSLIKRTSRERGSFYEIVAPYADEDLVILKAPVAPDTIGQCTGIFDKIGHKIFEGDILRVHSNIYGNTFNVKVYFRDGAFCFMGINENILGKPEHWDEGYAHGDEFYDYEIIGNIYDNPELLEVKV